MSYKSNNYSSQSKHSSSPKRSKLRLLLGIAMVLVGIWIIYSVVFSDSPIIGPSNEELFDSNVVLSEQLPDDVKTKLHDYAIQNDIAVSSELTISQEYRLERTNQTYAALVPVGEQFDSRRSIDPFSVNEGVVEDFQSNLPDQKVDFIPSSELTPDRTLLEFNGAYYLDSFDSGAVFATLAFAGDQAESFANFSFQEASQLNASSVLSVNLTGVTALTREMMNDLRAGTEPTFFSDGVGDFLASADITHVSNEVSFTEGCDYGSLQFCSPPEFIETLKASGVDVVELTGNHNNDFGSQHNTTTIEQYKELGWSYVGGGLNADDAARPYIVESDGTKFGMLAYNYPDAPNGAAIVGPETAGANPYSTEKMKADIQQLKPQVDTVLVSIQFWECYAYPDAYVEFPECDEPIGEQEPVFKSVIDSGADMVIGSSAHQPQIFEKYNDGYIYYGLGNLYFDQVQQPGTERGLILTNYYHEGKLLQTKISPTRYGKDFQTKLVSDTDAAKLIERLRR